MKVRGKPSRRRLRPYQQRAFRYTGTTPHPGLIMEMRLGKTPVCIRRLLAYQGRDRFLIVGPYSGLHGWERELRLEKAGSVAWLTGTRAERQKALQTGARWNLFNKEGHLSLPAVAGMHWDAVVLDESTFIKNPKAKVSKFYVGNFRECPHRWILTGTPNPEGDLDFVQQMLWLDGAFMGHRNFWSLRNTYYEPCMYDWVAKAGTNTKLWRALRERLFIVHRKDVGLEPRKVRMQRVLKMPRKVRRDYETAEDLFILEHGGAEVARTTLAVTRHGWLRQMCGGFIGNKLVWRGKVDELLYLLKGELARQQVVVWFAFNRELDACAEALRHAGISSAYVKGTVPQKKRGVLYDAFRAGGLRVLLLQAECATFGDLGLDVAHTAIYYSTPVRHLTRTQTGDRILSVEDKVLYYIDFVVEDSVDEDVLGAVEQKVKDSRLTLELANRLSKRVLARKKGK